MHLIAGGGLPAAGHILALSPLLRFVSPLPRVLRLGRAVSVAESHRDGAVLIAAPGWHDEHPGGASKLPTDFARYLAARGYDVTYLCPSNRVDRVDAVRVDGVDLRRYPAPAAPSPSVNNLRQHWQLTQQIARDVGRRQPVRALLGHTPMQYMAASGACDARVRAATACIRL